MTVEHGVLIGSKVQYRLIFITVSHWHWTLTLTVHHNRIACTLFYSACSDGVRSTT